MDPALILPPKRDERWELARQIGVEHAVVNTMNIGDGHRFEEYDELLRLANRFDNAGLSLSVIEESFPQTNTTVLGKEGRDDEISRFCEFLRNAGRVGVDTVCYDWMVTRWARTDTAVPTRGGSFTSAYNHEEMQQGPDHPDAPVTAEQLWSTLEYFLEQVVPVAEEAGVDLALHPNDPPISPVRGIDRIITSVEAYDRVINIIDSPRNGIAFCQGNFSAMDVDIPATIHHFGEDINYVHFRDVIGTAADFEETWHDQGPTDMGAATDAYEAIGFDGVARPDHIPTMVGETNDTPGYETKGRLFAIGYMRGLIGS